MEIDNRLIKEYLKNVYFVTGTAYAGKSSVCKTLSEKCSLHHCEENYNLGNFIELSDIDKHLNLNYFNTMGSWDNFVNRSKEEYESWINGVKEEIYEFEILELISLSKNKKVIVDTNIPLRVLREISDYSRVLVMVSTQEIAMKYFFDREDAEKQFLFKVINESKTPKQTLKNFQECIAYINRPERIEEYKRSKFYVIERKNYDEDIEDKIKQAETFFGFDKNEIEPKK